MKVEKPAVRWLSSLWEEGDILYYFEADEDGWVLRQVELRGPERTPAAAASLAELPDAKAEGGTQAVQDYRAKWGGLSDQPIPRWHTDFPHDDISSEEFEEVWRAARVYLEGS